MPNDPLDQLAEDTVARDYGGRPTPSFDLQSGLNGNGRTTSHQNGAARDYGGRPPPSFDAPALTSGYDNVMDGFFGRGQGPAMTIPAASPAAAAPPWPPTMSGIHIPGVVPVNNEDGSYSTELTATVQSNALNGGRPTLIPTIVEGRKLSVPEAIQFAAKSGLRYPSFDTIDQAEEAAVARSKAGGAGTAGFIGEAPIVGPAGTAPTQPTAELSRGAPDWTRHLPDFARKWFTPTPPEGMRTEAISHRSAAAQAELEARQHPYWQNLQSDEAKLHLLNIMRRRYNLDPTDKLPRPATAGEVLKEEFGTVQGLLEKLPYYETIATGAQLWKLHGALDRVMAGKGTTDDFETLTAAKERMVKESRGMTWGGMVAKIPAQSIPFGAELATGGAAGRVLIKGAEKVGENVVGKAATEAASAALRKMAEKAAGESTIRQVLTHAGIETVQRGLPNIALKTTAETMKKTLPEYEIKPGDAGALEGAITSPGQPFLEAVRDSGIDAVVQLYSEYTGKTIGIMASKAGRAGMALAKAGAKIPVARVIAVPAEKSGQWLATTRAAVAKALQDKHPNKLTTFEAAWAQMHRMGFNNTFEEIGEERIADIMDAAAKAVIESRGGKSSLPESPAYLTKQGIAEIGQDPIKAAHAAFDQLTAEFVGFLAPQAGTLAASALVPENRKFRPPPPPPPPTPPGPGEAEIPAVPAGPKPPGERFPAHPIGNKPLPVEEPQGVVVPRETGTSANAPEETLSDEEKKSELLRLSPTEQMLEDAFKKRVGRTPTPREWYQLLHEGKAVSEFSPGQAPTRFTGPTATVPDYGGLKPLSFDLPKPEQGVPAPATAGAGVPSPAPSESPRRGEIVSPPATAQGAGAPRPPPPYDGTEEERRQDKRSAVLRIAQVMESTDNAGDEVNLTIESYLEDGVFTQGEANALWKFMASGDYRAVVSPEEYAAASPEEHLDIMHGALGRMMDAVDAASPSPKPVQASQRALPSSEASGEAGVQVKTARLHYYRGPNGETRVRAIPVDAQGNDIVTPTEGEPNATQEGNQQEGRVGEHPGNGPVGTPTETGGGRGPERGPPIGQGQKEEVVTKPRRIRVAASELQPGDVIPGLSPEPVTVQAIQKTATGVLMLDRNGQHWNLENREFYVDRAKEQPSVTSEPNVGAAAATPTGDQGQKEPPAGAAGAARGGAAVRAGAAEREAHAQAPATGPAQAGPVETGRGKPAGVPAVSGQPADTTAADARFAAAANALKQAQARHHKVIRDYNNNEATNEQLKAAADTAEAARNAYDEAYAEQERVHAAEPAQPTSELPAKPKPAAGDLIIKPMFGGPTEIISAAKSEATMKAAAEKARGEAPTPTQPTLNKPEKAAIIQQEKPLGTQPTPTRPTAERPGGEGAAQPVRQAQPGRAEEPAPGGIRQEEGGGGVAPVGVEPGAKGKARPGGPGGEGGTGTRGVRNGEQPVPGAAGGLEKAPTQAEAEAKTSHSIDKAGLTDFVITNPDDLFAPGKNPKKTIYKRNLAAIRLVKLLDKEGRMATNEERGILARYQGWGTVAEPFDPQHRYAYFQSEWKKEYDELKSILTDAEFDAAAASTTNAMYTPPAVVGNMWDALQKLGFRGGAILESSAGVGHFFGLQPVDMANVSQRVAVEKDDISAAILRQLYAAADVRHSPFEEVTLPKKYFDLVISNFPFGEFGVHDKRYPHWQTAKIHDYFFVRSLDLIRPGGLIAAITTHGTMDKLSDRLRTYLAERADLVGAVRLNQDTLPGTKVTTDIIFLRKRAEKEPAGGESWVNSRPYEPLPGKYINEYFQNHPEMVLGEIKAGSLYSSGEEGPTETIVEAPVNYETQKDLAKALENLPANIYGSSNVVRHAEDLTDVIPSPKNMPVGSYFLSDGKLRRATRKGEAAENAESAILTEEGPKALERLKGLIALRDIALELYRASADPTRTGELPGLQKDLNQEYDRLKRADIVPINARANTTLLSEDLLSLSILTTLETVDAKTKKVSKGDIFTRAIEESYQRPARADTARDALSVSLDESNRIDLERIGELLGVDQEAARQQLVNEALIYETPGDGMVLASDYLSGAVRAKLKDAQALVVLDKKYQRNVEALTTVQPEDLPPSKITIRIGAPWVPGTALEDFLASMVGEEYRRNISVIRSTATGRWSVSNEVYGPGWTAAHETYGTEDYSVFDLIKDELNMKNPKVTWKDGDGYTHVDQDKTALARAKLQELKERFENWVWSHPKWSVALVREFNDTFNDWIPRRFDGSHLHLPGANPMIKLRPYQKDSVYRAISSHYNTLIAQGVGGGKTFTAVAVAQEAIRLGLARKVVIVVAKRTLDGFVRAARALYPAGRFVLLNEKDLAPNKRAKAFAMVAAAEKTVFVMPHEQFTALPVSEQTMTDFIKEQIREVEDAMAVAKMEKSDAGKRSVKQMKKKIEGMLKKLKDTVADIRRTAYIPFEEMGIDWVLYDEAHKVKNLTFNTQMEGIRGLGNPQGSDRAFDLLMKLRYVTKLQNGRGVTFLTGTPVNNSLSEIYNMQRFLQPDLLKEQGIVSFDDWVRMFATASADLESVVGEYKWVTRLREFTNLKGLYGMWDKMAHMVPHKEIERVVVAEKGDMPIIAVNSEGARNYESVVLSITPGQTKYRKELDTRMDEIKNRHRPVQKGDDIILSVMTDEAFAALDMRLVHPGTPEEPGGKLDTVARNVLKIYHDTKDVVLTGRDGKEGFPTQLVFINRGVPGGVRGFNTYDAVIKKLVDGGIPREQIATIFEAKNTKQADALFQRVNSGEIRILLGSMLKMGEGVNVQERALALHQVEAAWEPGTIVQMEGRIVRAGNLNPEVKLLRYITKGMSDEFMYSLLAAKNRSNNQFLNGEIDADSIQDVDIRTMAFQMAMAAGSQNQDILEYTKLDHKLRTLQAESRGHRDAQAKLAQAMAREKVRVGNLHRTLATEKKYQQWIHSLPAAEPFAISIGKTTYDKMTDAGKVLYQMAKGMSDMERRKVGTYRGQDVYLRFRVSDIYGYEHADLILNLPKEFKESQNTATLEFGEGRHHGLLGGSEAKPVTDALLRGWISRFDEMLHSNVAGVENSLASSKGSIEEFEKTLGQPFGKQNEMDALSNQVKELAASIAAIAQNNANQGAGHTAVTDDVHTADDEADRGDEDQGEEPQGGGGGGDTPWFGPKQETLLPDNITPEQRGWMREHWHEPLFGMGATAAAIPDPTGIMAKAQKAYGEAWDRIVDRLKHMKTPAGQRRIDFLAREYDAEWKLSAPVRDLFQRARGAKRYYAQIAGGLTEQLNAHVAAVRKKYEGKPWPKSAWRLLNQVIDGDAKLESLPPDMQKVYEEDIKPWLRGQRRKELGKRLKALQESTVRAWAPPSASDVTSLTEHAAIEDVLRGDQDIHSLTPEMQTWVENYKLRTDELTDYLLSQPHLVAQAKAGGLVNFDEIVRLRQSSGAAYLRRIYHMAKQPKIVKAVENRLAGPRIKMGMFKFKRSDEELWSVRLANGDIWQTPDSDAAFERMEREREAGRDQFGESIKQKVIVMAPIGDDIVESLGPVKDLRILLTRTLVDMGSNIAHMELFHLLAKTVGLSEAEYIDLPEEKQHEYVRVKDSEALGELANLYVPEAVWYNLMQEEQVYTSTISQIWDLLLTMFKVANVIYSPKTWMNNLLSQNAMWIYAGLNPITHHSTFVEAARRLHQGIDNPTIAKLTKTNDLTGGWDRDDISKFLSFLTNPKNKLTGAVGQFYDYMKRANKTLGAGYSFIDDVSKVASYIRDTEMLNLPHSWAIEQLRYFQNYDRLGKFAKRLRRAPWGDPFIAFPDQMVKITAKAAREHPMRVMALYAMPGVLNLASKVFLGVTDDEITILNTDRQRTTQGRFGFVQSAVDRYFQPILPWRGSDGLLRTWDMRWLMPLASDFRVATGPGGIGIPFLFSQPIVKPAMEVMFNRSLWTGQDVIDNSSNASSVWSAVKHIVWESAPVPTVAKKGVLRIYRAATGESGENLIQVALKEVFGVRIMRSYATKAGAYDAVNQAIDEKTADRAVRLIEFYNQYKSPKETPITEESAAQSIRARAVARLRSAG